MASVHCSHCGKDNLPEAKFCANCGSSLAVPPAPSPASSPVPISIPPARVTEYAGFWVRFAAFIIDYVILSFISFFLMILPSVMFIPFFAFPLSWLYNWLFIGLKGQTPGKMAVGIKVVNAEGSVPGLGFAALREIPGRIISSIVFCLGYLWIIWDGKKQGWHDKIAGTYVVPVKSRR